MTKVLLIVLLAAFASVTTKPMLSSVLGFGPATAFAQDEGDDLQGDDDTQ